jgi:hypothetical protein
MSNSTPIPPIVPGADADEGAGTDATKDVDGVDVLDDDANDELISSTDADALASRDPADEN